MGNRRRKKLNPKYIALPWNIHRKRKEEQENSVKLEQLRLAQEKEEQEAAEEERARLEEENRIAMEAAQAAETARLKKEEEARKPRESRRRSLQPPSSAREWTASDPSAGESCSSHSSSSVLTLLGGLGNFLKPLIVLKPLQILQQRTTTHFRVAPSRKT